MKYNLNYSPKYEKSINELFSNENELSARINSLIEKYSGNIRFEILKIERPNND